MAIYDTANVTITTMCWAISWTEKYLMASYYDTLFTMQDAPRIPYVEENTCPLGRGSEKVSGDMMLVDGGEEDWLRLHDIRYFVSIFNHSYTFYSLFSLFID